jgi:hypothetical protein
MRVKVGVGMRKMARSFFWIDQQIIRSGIWQQLSQEAKLVYVAVAASVDREGISQWGQAKLMGLVGKIEAADFEKSLSELEVQNLVGRGTADKPSLMLLGLSDEREKLLASPSHPAASANQRVKPPIVIYTTTTVTLGAGHAECADAD